jgi:hypothetical protein
LRESDCQRETPDGETRHRLLLSKNAFCEGEDEIRRQSMDRTAPQFLPHPLSVSRKRERRATIVLLGDFS